MEVDGKCDMCKVRIEKAALGVKGVKYALWDMFDENIFKDLTRNQKPLVKTYIGNLDSLMKDIKLPMVKDSLLLKNKAIK